MMGNKTIKNTNLTVDKYIMTRSDPSIILNHLERYSSLLQPNSSILDLGCGHGRDCKYFEDRGFKVVGIDLSKGMLKVANSVCISSILIDMNIMDCYKEDWKFDGIWACASLYHLRKKDFKILMSNLKYILNNNAILFIALKIGEGEKMIYKPELGVKKFYSLYSVEELKNIFLKNGFIIEDEILEKKNDNWINFYLRYRYDTNSI